MGRKGAHDLSFGEGKKEGKEQGKEEGSMLEKRKIIIIHIRQTDSDGATIASLTGSDRGLVRAIRAELDLKE